MKKRTRFAYWSHTSTTHKTQYAAFALPTLLLHHHDVLHITKSWCYNYRYCAQHKCESHICKDLKPDGKVLTAYTHAHKIIILSQQGANTHTQTTRQSKTMHHHAKIRLPSQLWILFLMLFISISPNPCSGACVNAHTCDLTLTLALPPFLFTLWQCLELSLNALPSHPS